MSTHKKPGVVIFTGDQKRLAKFYEVVTGFALTYEDDEISIVASDEIELIIHVLRREPQVMPPVEAREATYFKPFFQVASLAETRERAAAFGGRLKPASAEWSARDFRACEAIDPDGNVIQFREPI